MTDFTESKVRKAYTLFTLLGEEKNTKANTWCSKISHKPCLKLQRNLLDLWQHVLKINLMASGSLFKPKPNSFGGARARQLPHPKKRGGEGVGSGPPPPGVTGLVHCSWLPSEARLLITRSVTVPHTPQWDETMQPAGIMSNYVWLLCYIPKKRQKI